MSFEDLRSDTSLGDDTTLGNAEAQVSPVPGLPEGRRAWTGKDDLSRAAAYFEITSDERLSFRVSEVIDVTTINVRDEKTEEEITTVKLVCNDRRLDGVFNVFVDEVCDSLQTETDVVNVIATSAGEWRNLLQVARSPLSESALAGLYGELRFLEALVGDVGVSAIRTWQRSNRDVHDFIGASARVEVKTSSFQNRAAVTVHGLRQLQLPVSGTLTLAVAEVQRQGEDPIDAVIGRIQDLGVPIDELRAKLAMAGYVQGMSDELEASFSLVGWRYWEITRASPVLSASALEDSVALAVSDLVYSLDLSALPAPAATFDFIRLSVELEEPA
ncbi:hypothetical protein GCM10010922_28110 [Microbacterium sorbitolivorans]|uniref:PD-(D/E)XK motif protein n=1 Tax=Microbacterium sorbitolivorans TaxID=1867410 RepID=A0A367XT42_9MICO|nr:PD-(D/E)XK motif protein [Microbacterium sorbitolivorans]RCK56744.1 PD-(D/E)XK motif protein [Microbacterium sorbitolivorans]GGF50585.1 hypothetical protein GCM10010922_28110 [Microbacterium sorbitolivorans]